MAASSNFRDEYGGLGLSDLRAKKARIKERGQGNVQDYNAKLAFLQKKINAKKALPVPDTLEDAALGVAQEGSSLYSKGKGFNYPDFDTYVPNSAQTDAAVAGITQQAQQPHVLGGQVQDFTSALIGGDIAIDPSQYQALLGRSNDAAFQEVLDTQAGKLSEDITRSIGVGSDGAVGSAYHTGAVADQVGDMRNRAAVENFYRQAEMERGLLGDISGIQGANIGLRQAGAAAAPGAYDFQFSPYEKLGTAGAVEEDLAGRMLGSSMDKFFANDMSDWNRLGAYSGIFGGSGRAGPEDDSSSLFGDLAGGALIGSSLSGGKPAGALIGGGVSLLDRLFS